MSAATYGTLMLADGPTGKIIYSRNVYFPDAAASTIRFDSGSGAGAATSEFATWDQDVWIQDIMIGTVGTPAATSFRLLLNGNPTSQVFLVAGLITSVSSRPNLALKVPRGVRLGGIMTT
jgi:hypothetical protein